jgi:hypothetical protein
LDCSQAAPYQFFGVDWGDWYRFGWKPKQRFHAKFLVTQFDSLPTAGQIQGEENVRQFIGVPAIW